MHSPLNHPALSASTLPDLPVEYRFNKKNKKVPVELVYTFNGPEYRPISPFKVEAMRKYEKSQARLELRTRAAEYKRQKEEEEMLDHPMQQFLSQKNTASKRDTNIPGKKKFVKQKISQQASPLHEYDDQG